jgi:hypothetical protein
VIVIGAPGKTAGGACTPRACMVLGVVEVALVVLAHPARTRHATPRTAAAARKRCRGPVVT